MSSALDLSDWLLGLRWSEAWVGFVWDGLIPPMCSLHTHRSCVLLSAASTQINSTPFSVRLLLQEIPVHCLWDLRELSPFCAHCMKQTDYHNLFGWNPDTTTISIVNTTNQIEINHNLYSAGSSKSQIVFFFHYLWALSCIFEMVDIPDGIYYWYPC